MSSSAFLHQTQQQQPLVKPYLLPPRHPPAGGDVTTSFVPFFNRTGLFIILTFMVLLGVIFPWLGHGVPPAFFSNNDSKASFAAALAAEWRDYTLAEAAAFVAKNGTIIVCTVSHPYLSFLNNWLISISRQKHQDKVLVIAEDYATLFQVNKRWPGHAVLIPPAPNDGLTAHKFGSQGNHDVYFIDDMAAVKPLDHPHNLPPPGKKGRTYICSCMIFLHPTSGAKKVMKKWIEELQVQPWSKKTKTNDQPAYKVAANCFEFLLINTLKDSASMSPGYVEMNTLTTAGGSVSAAPVCIPIRRTILQKPDMGSRNQGMVISLSHKCR
ncbi:hypothetical protein ACLOJK_010080 [Asimina triloba]